ncbi:MAG: leucyl aminopeptidase [Streptosporangiales bacterium]|nr:leucyl aminopeptidase [Streptosporangiales bacterium]
MLCRKESTVPIDPQVSLVAGPLFAEAAEAAAGGSEGQASGRDIAADVVAVPVRPGPDGPTVAAGAAEVAERIESAKVLAHAGMHGDPGEVTGVPLVTEDGVIQLLFVGLGDGTPHSLRRAGAALARGARGRSAVATTIATGLDGEGLSTFVEGLLLASYTFSCASRPKNRNPAGAVALVVDDPAAGSAALARAETTARAVAFARDLVNTPSAEKSPDWLAEQAVAAAEGAGITAVVRGEAELRAEGFGGILAVGMGSARPPRFVELSYPGAADDPSRPHVVLVGKGITFDSGGLSLKPGDNMKLMKTDMAGGAAVIAVMGTLRDLGIRARVTGLVAAAENLPSGSAQRPGDVITQYGGRTVEVLNTDAEGRLVLADALAYADRVLEPDAVVDLATLTGAARVALGTTHAPLYANDDGLAEELTRAGTEGGDRLWRMPLAHEYRDALDSEVADLANISRKDYGAGSVVAALFLAEFAGRRPWAHLDIAGAARASSDEHEITKGGTGFGVRLLLRWLAAFPRS